jgi:hypothetical protein
MPVTLLDSQAAIREPLGPDEPGLVLDVALAPDELVAAAIAGLGLIRSLPTGTGG